MTTITTARDVALFVPNLIGYARVFATLLSLILMIAAPHQWLLAIILYICSFVGDLFDGMAARKLNQCSTFGGLLDMVTDRCATLGLLFVLMGEYDIKFTEYTTIYKLLISTLGILDISSHWCQMYSTAALQLHHKSSEGNKGRFILVQWYYDVYLFFGYCCVAAEFTYICLYVLNHAVEDGILYKVCYNLLLVCIPGCATKNIVNLFQLSSACAVVAQHDANVRNDINSKDKTKSS
mmetsp:Transcript_22847/g.21971  ORF Transcript_22847/g.21971 Transcript_22847/m.21971 type:complete len:237 (-) Transcript_22847:71-781(-)